MGEVIVDWKALGAEGPEGKKDAGKDKKESASPSPESADAARMAEIAAQMKAIEARHPQDASIDAGYSLKRELIMRQNEIGRLTQEKGSAIERAKRGALHGVTLEEASEKMRRDVQRVTAEYDRRIEGTAQDMAWFDRAVKDLDSGDTRAAEAYIGQQEAQAESELRDLSAREQALWKEVEAATRSGNIDALTEATAAYKKVHSAANARRGDLARFADQRAHLSLKGEKARIEKKADPGAAIEAAASVDDLKAAIEKMGGMTTSDGKKVSAKELGGIIDQYMAGVTMLESFIPRAMGLREKVKALKEGGERKAETGPKKIEDAATFDELKASVEALGTIELSDGRKLSGQEVNRWIDAVVNAGAAVNNVPRAHGIRQKVTELLTKNQPR